MSGHLSEDDLIRHLFDLASSDEQAAAGAHLEACAACRTRRDRLQARFSTLDELHEPVEVSEALIAQAVTPPPRRIWWRAWPTWAAAAAAVMILGVIVTQAYRSYQGRAIVATSTPPAPDVAPGEPVPMATRPKPMTGPDRMQRVSEQSQAGAISDGSRPFEKTDLTAEIDAIPPFAPASAIELNVLPRRDDLQLTIYNAADLTLVRETRTLTFKRGWNWLQLMWANTLIDPTSLTLEPLEHADKIEVRQLVFPPRLKELGRWLVRSEVTGAVPVRITYMTSGISWRAFYMGTLTSDETKMHLAGYVRVDNGSGEDYERAQTRLVVGQVRLLDAIAELARRRYPYGSPVPTRTRGRLWYSRDKEIQEEDELLGEKPGLELNGHGMMPGMGGFGGGMVLDRLERKEIAKEGLSEYFLYTIEGTETIPNGWGKRLPSFEAEAVPVESLYKYDESRWGTDAVRYVSFANDDEHKLGRTPIPNGDVRIYRQNADGHLSYVGGTGIKYIPVNEKVELNLGADPRVKVEPVLMAERTENYRFDDNGNISGWDAVRTWQVTVTNTRALPIIVEVYRKFETPYWTTTNEGDYGDYEKDDVTTAKYTLTLEPRSKQRFRYVLTTYHGTRQEDFKAL